MSDAEASPVVPIRPGVGIKDQRSFTLLEAVAEHLGEFEAKHGTPPMDIAFVVIGEDGTYDRGWLIEDRWRSNLALAGAFLSREAVAPDE